MAISLFGKKDEPPTKKKTTTGVVEKPGDPVQKPAPPPEAAPASGDDDFSLDFSHYAPPPPQAKPAPPEPPRQPAAPAQKPTPSPQAPKPAAPAPQAPASKPGAPAVSPPQAAASKPVVAQAPAPGATPSAPPRPAVAAAAPAAPKPAEARAPVASGRAADMAPIIEEAAILFASGQSMQALRGLRSAVHEGRLGPCALQAWLMLFDLYQHLGMKAEFEELGMQFLANFERSPPVWVETETRFNPALATGGFGYCALTGTLSEESTSELEQLRRIGERQHAMRIDFSRLQEADPFGAAHLLEALHVLKAAGKAVMITGEAQLLDVLAHHCQAGHRETDGILWSLLFEILQRLGLKERFEEAAVDYAVTYEVSPPSWESQVEEELKSAPRAAADEAGQAAFRLSGDVTGAREILAKRLQEWAAANSPLVIDMSAVRRVDFASAGQLLDVFTRLHQAGAVIQIRGANELVAALFDVIGIGQVARVIRNR